MIIENGVLIKVEESDINEDGSFIIPEGVTEIGNEAFRWCKELVKIEIPEGITKIGDLTFGGCENLISVRLPQSLIQIGNGAFGRCSNLTSIEIPEGVTEIGANTFRECIKITSIKLPQNLAKIGDNAFRECSELQSIEIPEGVTEIGYDTFRACRKITSIKLSQNLAEIRDGAFMECSELQSIEIPEGVTEINSDTFRECRKMTSIKLPQNLAKIGDSAFMECSELQSIEIPEGVVEIGADTFRECRKITSIKLSQNLAEIGDRTFMECSELQSIEIPEGVTEIGADTFVNCGSLTSIKLSDNLVFLGNYVFKGCRNLKSIEIPEGVTEIGLETFSGCSNLSSIKLTDNVKYIGSYVFAGCNNLTSIRFSENITEIWENAFKDSRRELKISALKQNKNVINGLEDTEQNNLTFLTSIRDDYRELEVGNILKEVIRQGVEEKYRELEELEKRVSEKDKEKILEIIWHEKQSLRLEENLEEQLEEKILKISKWLDKGFVPSLNLYKKISEEKVDIFDKKIWLTLAKEPVFNKSQESKMALVELAYVFGVFEKDVVELRGQRRNIRDLTAAERRNGEFEDYQKRIRKILELVQAGKLTNRNLHTMFDGTDMKFKPEFYRFFLDNINQIVIREEIPFEQRTINEIFYNPEIMQNIPKIQREMEKIVEEYRGQIPTLEECIRYFSEIAYDEMKDENRKLAELCKLCGVTYENFVGYQEIYEEQKKRRESTIPTLKGRGYEILDLDDPKTLLIGEGKFSRCCQKLGGVGEECMRHSAHSENGRIIEITDDDGTLIAQSWMWRNGNVVCFDSIEANAIESHKYSDADRKRLIDKIEQTYREVGKELIEESEEQVEKFRKSKLEEIEKMEGEEKERALKVLEEVCEESKVKRVTVGRGFWPISQKTTERFSEKEVSTENGRVNPRENVGYLNDSDIQYIVAEVDDVKEIKTDDARVEVKYRDKRRVEIEEGINIQEDTISKVKKIEQEAHKEQMQIMSGISTIEGLSEIYETTPERMKVITGEDWYLIYSEEENEIHIHDLARGKTRFEDEELVASKEILEGIDKIIEESIESGKEINAEIREDTSYLLMLRMKERGLIEQIGEDIAFEFEIGSTDRQNEYTNEENYNNQSQPTERIITEEEQKEILSRSADIREQESKEEKTIMHRFKFKPTEKYKARLEMRKKKKDEIGNEI